MENAIANHEFEKARFYSDEERKERENLRLLREKYNIDETAMGVVTQDDIEEVVARWTGVPVTSIKEEEGAKLLRIEEELHKRIISQDRQFPLWRAPSAVRVRLEAAGPPRGIIFVPGTDRSGKDGNGPYPHRFLIWFGARPGAL